ncbi:hypothetical protein [Paraburkholderia gardini]|uniref:Uncharacterized protein n=1 Tax=Paraburkholderia gardini TaxID=2823469 RepID=A0ABM8U9G0_9BURK|nr:hypothetical protein [Paraburkholderia gardini]CAG4919317.1 hypothetical protein R54767_04596 [Paraburkholderia gardini]
MNSINQEYFKNLQDVLSDRSADFWTMGSGALAAALTQLEKSAETSAVVYETLGRTMADQAARLAADLIALGEGVGTESQRAFLLHNAQAISLRIDDLRAGGAAAYAEYGEAIAAAARGATSAKAIMGVGAFVDGITLASAVNDAQRTGNWTNVASAIGSIIAISATVDLGIAAGTLAAGYGSAFPRRRIH